MEEYVEGYGCDDHEIHIITRIKEVFNIQYLIFNYLIFFMKTTHFSKNLGKTLEISTLNTKYLENIIRRNIKDAGDGIFVNGQKITGVEALNHLGQDAYIKEYASRTDKEANNCTLMV